MISMPARSNAIEERRQPRASLRQSRMLIQDRVLLPRNWSNRAARSALLVTASLMRLRLATNFGFAPVTKIRCCKCTIQSCSPRHWARDLHYRPNLAHQRRIRRGPPRNPIFSAR
jgi:hypothetical protein